MAGPVLLGGADGRVKMVRSRDEMSGLEKVLLGLAHDAGGAGTFLRDRVEYAEASGTTSCSSSRTGRTRTSRKS